MNYSKNYVLSLLRAESKESKKVQSQRKAAFESKKSRKFEEQRGEFYFNPSDRGMSGSKTYSFNGKVEIKDIGGDNGLQPIETVTDFNVLSSDIESDMHELGYFLLLKTPEGEYGFHFETEEGTMIYGYASTVDELKSQVELLGEYLDLPSIPWDDFVAAVDGVNEDADDDESWRTEWKTGSGNDFGYDHNEPLLFKQTPDGEVSMTVGKNPYYGDGYVGEADFEDDFIVETGDTVEEVLNKLNDYGAITNYFDLNMPSQDLLDYIESTNEEDLNLEQPVEPAPVEDYEVDVQEVPEDTKMEGSVQYSFDIPCVVTAVITADSQDLAKEILKRNKILELMEDEIEFADGDGVIREVSFENTDIDNLQAFDEFNPEVESEPYFK